MSVHSSSVQLKKQETTVLWFADIRIQDIPVVGGKNASLGEMYSQLTSKGIRVPNGFAITAHAYRNFLKEQQLYTEIKSILTGLDVKNVTALTEAGKKIRARIMAASFSAEFIHEVSTHFDILKQASTSKYACSVAVRSSATAEDLPDASFAGQQETFLNVRTVPQLLKAVQECYASLFTDRAISYREAHGYDHMDVFLSVTVQNMVRSDKGASGVMFTLDTESGFDKVVLINAAYGLGEYVVKGRITPDQYYIFKPTLAQGKSSIISKRIGSKSVKLVYSAKGGTKQERVPKKDQEQVVLSDADIKQLAEWGVLLESYYGRAQDIEWAKDGYTGELFIVQSRPETVKSNDNRAILEQYILKGTSDVLLEGIAIGNKIGSGVIRNIESPKDMKQFQSGDVLVTRITDPDWEPIMRIASAIITEEGGKTSHAAIVSREIGVPAIVGAKKARSILKEKAVVTVDCTNGDVGRVLKGRLPFEVKKTEITHVQKTNTKIMMNIGDPEHAFELAALPHDGVGLARLEFIFTTFIKIHPLALVHYKKIKDKGAKKKIQQITVGYKDKKQFAIDRLAEGIAKIAAASYPHQCIVRLSDFKTNEYATMLGGSEFEPKEENPMLGWRGASRYYSEVYKPAFELECEALKKVRNEWGLTNVTAMVPFCRTPEEGQKVLDTMAEFGLKKGDNGLQVYVMCEIPSNVILADDFAELFDGFSIGSNDLTQMILGVDRDSASVSHLTNPNHKAVKKMIKDVIRVAHKHKKKIGICGEAPSDDPEFAEFLVQLGIDSMSLNPDSIIPIRERIANVEKTIGKTGKKTNISMLSIIAGFGLIGSMLISIGAGCGGYVSNNIEQQSDVLVTPAEIRIRTEQRMLQQQERGLVGKMTELFVDDFAQFTISYPVDWRIRQWRGGVTMQHASSSSYVTVTRQLVSNPVVAEDTVPIQINGMNGRRYESELFDNTKISILEFEYNGQTIEVSGTGPEFDTIINTLLFVSSTSPEIPNNRPMTQWDIRERRACIQVVTFARQSNGQCIAYPTPCDVPDGWIVCDGGDA
jgi:pyruvate,water dikinase